MQKQFVSKKIMIWGLNLILRLSCPEINGENMTKEQRLSYRYSNCFKHNVIAAIEKEGLNIESTQGSNEKRLPDFLQITLFKIKYRVLLFSYLFKPLHHRKHHYHRNQTECGKYSPTLPLMREFIQHCNAQCNK